MSATNGGPSGPDRSVRRVAVLSVHSSPLSAPGIGDSGGMNVYIRAVAAELAARDVASDLITRATDPAEPEITELQPGVRLLRVAAGPLAPVPKQTLGEHVSSFVCALLRATDRLGPYDVLHSHYWLSGWVARLVAERWDVPFVHSFHTLGRVKNASLASGDRPEPPDRLNGEERVAAAADRLIVPTPAEARQLVDLYGASPSQVRVVPPGVDHDRFRPGNKRAARRRLALGRRHVLAFVGRLQPLKGADLAVRALAALRAAGLDAELLVVGGGSGSGEREPAGLRRLAARERVSDAVRFLAPLPQEALADVYRAADLLLVPSHSESFGLVALEAQACGTPVVAARVGGLPYAVRDGASGVLLASHDPAVWAGTIGDLLRAPSRRAALGAGGLRFAASFAWPTTVDRLLAVYRELTGAVPAAALERTS